MWFAVGFAVLLALTRVCVVFDVVPTTYGQQPSEKETPTSTCCRSIGVATQRIPNRPGVSSGTPNNGVQTTTTVAPAIPTSSTAARLKNMSADEVWRSRGGAASHAPEAQSAPGAATRGRRTSSVVPKRSVMAKMVCTRPPRVGRVVSTLARSHRVLRVTQAPLVNKWQAVQRAADEENTGEGGGLDPAAKQRDAMRRVAEWRAEQMRRYTRKL